MSADFSAIVLAGGQSARMGRAKAALRFGAETMLERVVRRLAREFSDIVIVAAPRAVAAEVSRVAGAKMIHDESAYGGPADALARGLRAVRNPAAFACSCDLPLIDSRLARRICAMLADDDVVVPRVDDRYQPLHAAWSVSCADTLAEMHRAGEGRLINIVRKLHARIVDEAELRSSAADLQSFLNVNTPEDYDRALKLAGLK